MELNTISFFPPYYKFLDCYYQKNSSISIFSRLISCFSNQDKKNYKSNPPKITSLQRGKKKKKKKRNSHWKKLAETRVSEIGHRVRPGIVQRVETAANREFEPVEIQGNAYTVTIANEVNPRFRLHFLVHEARNEPEPVGSLEGKSREKQEERERERERRGEPAA